MGLGVTSPASDAIEDEGDSESSISANECFLPGVAVLFNLEVFRMGTGEGLASILEELTDLIAPAGLRDTVAKDTMTVWIVLGRRLGWR